MNGGYFMNQLFGKRKKQNFSFISFFLTILSIVFLFVMVFVYKYHIADDMIVDNTTPKINLGDTSYNSSTESSEKQANKDTTISITATGDIMCQNTQFQDAYIASEKNYDFSYVFSEIKPYFENSDINFANLETTMAGSEKKYSGYPTFNTPEQLAQNLKDLGINVVSTANNHCMDRGYNGLVSTLNYLDKANIAHTGTYASEEDSHTFCIKDIKGIKIAFLSYTYGTNGIAIPKDKTYCVNLTSQDKIKEDLENVKEKNVDLIIASMHWGTEYSTQESKEQEEMADFLFENGVDIIIGNHPHVLQSMHKKNITLEDGTKKDVFVAYSLGNFMSAQNKANTTSSILLNLKVSKHTGTNVEQKITIDSVGYYPIYFYKDPTKTSQKFRIVDVNQNIRDYENNSSKIKKDFYQMLVQAKKNIEKNVGTDY